jgi:acyl-CoA synthetase (NDP forming)
MGPNCLGYVNYVDNVPLTLGGAAPSPLSGRRGLAIISQSGAMASVMRAALQARDIAISYSISTGNEALNGIEDFLEYLIADEATRVIAMLAEQIRNPKRFLPLARKAREAGKPVVLLHPGRGSAARASARTHTGALSGDYDVMRALVTNAGVIVVESLEELIDVSELTLRWPTLPSGGTAIITESGAFKGLALDAAEELGLTLPEPSSTTKFVLGALAPDLILPTNPLDLTAQALVDPDLYRKTMKPLLDDPQYGSMVLAIILSSPELSRRKMQPIMETLAQLQPLKPTIFAMLGEEAEVPREIIANLRNMDVPFFRSPERALRALARVVEFTARPQPAPAATAGATPSVRLSSGTIPEHASKRLLADFGIAVPEGELVTDLQGARAAAARIGYPVALKAQAAALAHKSDAGGVILALSDDDALARGWQRLHANLSRTRPGLALDGVLIEAMARPGVEIILGARGDPDWGPVLVVGLGGIWAEALHDVRTLPPDLAPEDIAKELLKLKGAVLLRGYRGAPALDMDAVADMAAQLGAFVVAHPEIAEVDLNPVVVHARGKGAIALDALIVTR